MATKKTSVETADAESAETPDAVELAAEDAAASDADVETAAKPGSVTDDGFIVPGATAGNPNAKEGEPTQVKLLGQLTGKYNGNYWPPKGSVVTVTRKMARAMVNNGTGELVE